MTALIWIGTLLTLIGVGVLGWCIYSAARLRLAKLPDTEMRRSLAQLAPFNLGGLALSALGLILVVAGIVLG